MEKKKQKIGRWIAEDLRRAQHAVPLRGNGNGEVVL
jgi:hypothetical protein